MIDARRPHTRASVQTIIGVLAVSAALVLGLFTPVSANAAMATSTARSGAGIEATGIAKTTLVGFSAGNIISDVVFTNKSTMTAAQIQTFLNGKVSTCRSGYTCLKDLKTATQTKAADKYCAKYTGSSSESAATIIYKVAQACGINPQVLIVMLQKEQGLITHTWPSDWRYNAAMGQACPDTAPCNVAFAGFFAQVYGAARQMKIYMDGVYFTWYAPGKTWNIQYHPNTACGTKAVAVANKATSALYYYTPYQPNAAALAAGLGTGNACSSYGNRNFYNYFTSWFGSTQSVAGTVAAKLIKSGDPVYLISGTNRYHVQKADYNEFVAAFGAPTTVAASYVDAFTDSGAASLYLRNASTGDVSYLRDGQRHRFSSCAMVAAWGSKCETETRLVSTDYTKLTAGSDMTWFATTAYSTATMLIEGSVLRPVYDAATVKALNGGTTPYAALMPSSVAAGYTKGVTKFKDASYLTMAGSSDVLLPTADARLVRLASWAYSAEFGLPSSVAHKSVPATATSGYTKSGTITVFATCGSTVYAASAKKLYPVSAAAVQGFDAPQLDASTCAALSLQKTKALDKVFVQGTGQNEVYYAQNGVLRHVTTRAAVYELTGGTWPTILPLSAETVAKLPKGDRILQAGGGSLPAGEFVRTEKSTRVYLPLADDKKLYLPSWAYAAELGLPASQRIIASSTLDAFTESGNVGLFVTCGTQAYVAAQGTLHPVAASAMKGFPAPTLDAATCKLLTLAKETPAAAVYVQGIGRNEVYLAQDGVFRHVTTQAALLKLGGGVRPTVLRVSAATIDVLAKGTSIK